MTPGVLFSQMDPDPALELAFHRWYDREHVPARMRVPGFLAARRYVVDGAGPFHLAVYHVDDLAVLSSPAYRQVKQDPGPETSRQLARVQSFTRYVGRRVSDTGATDAEPGRLMAIGFDVPPGDVADFDAWYEEEHVGLLMDVPGWLRVRRYEVESDQQGPRMTHLALHEIAGPSVLDAPERSRLRTPWRARLAARPWFGAGLRWRYRPVAGFDDGGE